MAMTGLGGGWRSTGAAAGAVTTAGGTPTRFAKFITPTSIGDALMSDNGVDITSLATIFFNNGLGIDVVASGGVDVLNVGVSNADTINYGYSGTTHNFIGTTINQNVTNLNVKDKLITINDGGAAASGGSSGFEIEEAGIATGYFIQNAGRTGYDFKASSNASVITLSFIGVAANQTMTVQNASGTIAYLSDIPVTTTFYAQGGNTFGAVARLGTNDLFALEFETNNTLYGQIGSDGRWSIGTVAPVAGTRLTVTGIGPGTTYAARFYNSTPTDLLSIRDDGVVSINGASAVDPLTLTGIFASTQSAFTFIHSGAILWLNGNTVQSLWYIQDGSNAAFGTYNEKGLRIHTNNITRLAFSADGASLTFTNSLDLVFGSAAGNKIGTATTQKIGFYNATPIVQGASVADATDAASAITQLNLLISRIEATGLIATI